MEASDFFRDIITIENRNVMSSDTVDWGPVELIRETPDFREITTRVIHPETNRSVRITITDLEKDGFFDEFQAWQGDQAIYEEVIAGEEIALDLSAWYSSEKIQSYYQEVLPNCFEAAINGEARDNPFHRRHHVPGEWEASVNYFATSDEGGYFQCRLDHLETALWIYLDVEGQYSQELERFVSSFPGAEDFSFTHSWYRSSGRQFSQFEIHEPMEFTGFLFAPGSQFVIQVLSGDVVLVDFLNSQEFGGVIYSSSSPFTFANNRFFCGGPANNVRVGGIDFMKEELLCWVEGRFYGGTLNEDFQVGRVVIPSGFALGFDHNDRPQRVRLFENQSLTIDGLVYTGPISIYLDELGR